jgi:hypothetical protein
MREPAPAPAPAPKMPMPSVAAEPPFEGAAQTDLAPQGDNRRKLAWASAAVATGAAAFVGLAYLPREDTAPSADMSRAQTRINSGQVTPPRDPASAPLAHAELLEKAPPSAGTGPRVAPPAPTRPRAATPQPNPAPRVAAARAPAHLSRHEKPVANDKPPLSRRCIDIIQRVSLGEPLAPEERDLLKQECGQ